MTKHLTAALSCVLSIAACGGGGGGGNAAEGKAFTYEEPVAASSTEASALQAQLAALLAFQGTPGADGAEALADFSAVTAALLGDSEVGLAQASSTELQRRALQTGNVAAKARLGATSGGFDDPRCAVVSADAVGFDGCTVSLDSGDMQGELRVDGSVTLSTNRQAVAWDLTLTMDLRGMGDSSGFGATARYHRSGNLAFTETTLQGKSLAELSASASGNGQSTSASAAESVEVDLTYQASPPCVTGGTLEAKRVWTRRPAGASATELPDAAAKVTWTGCGEGTIAFSR